MEVEGVGELGSEGVAVLVRQEGEPEQELQLVGDLVAGLQVRHQALLRQARSRQDVQSEQGSTLS